MTAADALIAATCAALTEADGLAAITHVFDAPPARAALPYALVEDPVLTDWSTKSWAGREARLGVTLFDAGERPTRLRGLCEAAEGAVLGLAPDLGGGWRLVGMALARSRIARSVGDRWLAQSEFRARVWRES